MRFLDDPGTREDRSAFVPTVAARYLELRGSGLVLSTLDLERIRRWEASGVPLDVALRSLDRAHAAWMAGGRAQRRRPFPLERVESEIESALATLRRRGLPLATPVSTAAPAPDYAEPFPSASDHSEPEEGIPTPMENEEFRPLSSAIKSVVEDLHARAVQAGFPAPPAAAPASSCAHCHGRGYRLGTDGAHAVARLCTCERHCAACGGRGFLVHARDGYEFSERCACQSLPQRVAAYNAAQLPARFWDKTFDNFYVGHDAPRAIRDAKEAFRDFALGKGPSRLGLGLIGGPGRGKTHLLAATLATLALERGVRCRYVEISFLFADLKAAISDPRARATVDKIDELAQVDVLAIDELGKGRGSTFEEEVLDELIGRRYNNEKPTLFATNHPLEERPGEPFGESLLSRVGPRIFSRLHEMVVFLELPARVDDHRLLLRKMMR